MGQQVTVLVAALLVMLLVPVFAVLAHVAWRLVCRLTDRRETGGKTDSNA